MDRYRREIQPGNVRRNKDPMWALLDKLDIDIWYECCVYISFEIFSSRKMNHPDNWIYHYGLWAKNTTLPIQITHNWHNTQFQMAHNDENSNRNWSDENETDASDFEREWKLNVDGWREQTRNGTQNMKKKMKNNLNEKVEREPKGEEIHINNSAVKEITSSKQIS